MDGVLLAVRRIRNGDFIHGLVFVPLVETRGVLKYFPCILLIALCYVGLEQ